MPSPQGVLELQNGISQTNLLNKYKNGQTPPSTTKSNNNEPLRNYIPSPMGVQLNQGEDMTEAEKAMRKAEIAEQQALQTLKMN